MKRLLWPVCVVLIAIVLFSGFGQVQEVTLEEPTTVSEAAFAVRNSDGEDVTSFLVGNFQGDQGMALRFDGTGKVQRAAVNLETEEGTVALTQTPGSTALLQITFDGQMQLYTFRLISDAGDFMLTDANGNSEIFTPVL